jgi:VWFA-related protein
MLDSGKALQPAPDLPGEFMSMQTRLAAALLVTVICAAAAASQEESKPPDSDRIYLDVVVTPKAGSPVTGLHQEDFTILDDKTSRPITSFRAVSSKEVPVEIIVVIDAVNMGFQSVDYERLEISKFLRAGGGRLAHPTALAILTDTGIKQIQDSFSSDGNALSAALSQETVALRSIGRSAAYWGAVDRFQMSLSALQQLVAQEASRPGRKIIVWVSPGWPLLSGPEAQLDSKQEQGIFDNIVNFSTSMRQARVTLYSVDPLGNRDFGSRTFYYETFVKGVSGPNQVNLGDLGLQVLAVQSGGLALSVNNDVAKLLQRCVADTDAYYEISFSPAVETRRNEYHHLEIKMGNSALVARTRQGYYAQPELSEMQKLAIPPPVTR